MHMPRGRYNEWSGTEAIGVNQYAAPYGVLQSSVATAIAYRDYLHRFGGTRAGLGRFLVNNRANAQLNPHAYFRGKQPLTLDEYLDGRMIADPISVNDCDIPIDGCAAIVLTSSERAQDLKNPPAYISGYGHVTRTGPSELWWQHSDLDYIWSGGESLAQKLWSTSGLSPREIQAAMLYDGFSTFVLYWLESLGFCSRGEAWRFMADGATDLGGQLPVNTNGGSIGEGRIHGMAQICEGVYQVTGRAQERQVTDVEHVVVTIGPTIFMSGGLVLSSADY